MSNRSPYDISKSEIKSGDIVFIRGENEILLDRIIMFFTGSEYTHVGIACWMKDDSLNISRLMLIDIQGFSKRRIINLSSYSEFDIDIIQSPLPWEDVAKNVLKDVALREYDWFQSIYVGVKEWLQRNNISFIKLPKMTFKHEMCSEFVAKTYKLENTQLSPQKLFEQLQDNGYKIKVKLKGKKPPTTKNH